MNIINFKRFRLRTFILIKDEITEALFNNLRDIFAKSQKPHRNRDKNR